MNMPILRRQCYISCILANSLLRRPAKYLFGLLVPFQDFIIFIKRDNSIQRMIDDRTYSLLTIGKRSGLDLDSALDFFITTDLLMKPERDKRRYNQTETKRGPRRPSSL